MVINLAKSAGFCFGVERAIRIALETARAKENVNMLGDIVHNEHVIKMIKKTGIKKIKKLAKGKNKTLLIRAHGTSTATLNRAKRLGYKIVDATCPMVKEIHRIARAMEKRGYKLIVIGDKKHDEVSGIIGQLNGKAIVIDNQKNIPLRKIKKLNKACLIVQSTQNIDKVNQIAAILKRQIKDLKFFNTICRTTRIKQQEIKSMPSQNDVMVIIGSKTSANTKRLYEISKSLNRHTYWVQSKYDLKQKWLKGISSIGITAGASTPDSITKEVIKRLRALSIN